MLEGKRFFGATGIPIANTALVSTRLADWLPDPLTVDATRFRSTEPRSAKVFSHLPNYLELPGDHRSPLRRRATSAG